MNSHPLMSEHESAYRRDELFIAAGESRGTDKLAPDAATRGFLARMTDQFRIGKLVNMSPAQPTGAGHRAGGN